MKVNAFLIILCLLSTVMLSGCVGEGGGGSGDSWSSSWSSGSSGGTGDSGSGGSNYGEDSGTGASAQHNPEPATMAMIGVGLFAYGILNKKKKK